MSKMYLCRVNSCGKFGTLVYSKSLLKNVERLDFFFALKDSNVGIVVQDGDFLLLIQIEGNYLRSEGLQHLGNFATFVQLNEVFVVLDIEVAILVKPPMRDVLHMWLDQLYHLELRLRRQGQKAQLLFPEFHVLAHEQPVAVEVEGHLQLGHVEVDGF